MKEELLQLIPQKYKGDYYEQLYANKLDNLEEMNKFLETCNLPRLNHDAIRNLNRLIASKNTEIVINSFPTDKSPGSDGFTGEFYQTSKELILVLLKLFQKLKRGELFQKHFIRPVLPCYSDKNTTRKENYRSISLINIIAKILNKMLANSSQQYIKRIIHHDQVLFIPGMQGWLDILKPVSVIYHINKMKDKNHMIILINTKKHLTKFNINL